MDESFRRTPLLGLVLAGLLACTPPQRNAHPGDLSEPDDPVGDDAGSRTGAGDPPLPTPAPPSFCETLSRSGDWTSTRVSYGSDGKLKYAADDEQNRIVD